MFLDKAYDKAYDKDQGSSALLTDSLSSTPRQLNSPHYPFQHPASGYDVTLGVEHAVEDIGLDVRVKNNSPILFGNGQVGYIRMIQPYDGLTPELIGLHSTSSELITAYGEPKSKSGSEWHYEEITFIVKNQNVQEMIIQDPGFYQ